MNLSKKCACLFLSAFLFFISSFPFSGSFVFGWFCLIPLIKVIDTTTTPKESFCHTYIGGVFIALLSLYWLMYVTVLGWMLLSLYMGLYIGVFGLIRFYKRSIIYSSITWYLLEYVKSNIGTGIPCLLVGATQVRFLPLLQLAAWIGVYGVSFIAILYNLLLYESIFNKSKKAFFTFLVILCGIIIFGSAVLDTARPEKESLNVEIVQPNIPQYIKLDYSTLPRQIEVIKALSYRITSSDLLVYPETVVPDITHQKVQPLFCRIAKDKHTWIILGSQGKEKIGKRYKYYNSAFLITPDGHIKEEYRKIHLVPFGEYIPFRDKIPFLRFLIPIGEDFSKGEEYTVFNLGKKKVSTLICFEDMFPALVRRFVQKGAMLLVNITNDAWFGKSAAPYQHLALSVFRAVENRRWLIRCTNTGISAYIDPFGRIEWIEPFKKQVAVHKVFLIGDHTFYTSHGDLPFMALLIVTLILHHLPNFTHKVEPYV